MNFEIERLRQFNESKEHWAVRKAFLDYNWQSRQSVDSLASLSWCYSNMINLGTSYPSQTCQTIQTMIPPQTAKSVENPIPARNTPSPAPSSLIPARRSRKPRPPPRLWLLDFYY